MVDLLQELWREDVLVRGWCLAYVVAGLLWVVAGLGVRGWRASLGWLVVLPLWPVGYLAGELAREIRGGREVRRASLAKGEGQGVGGGDRARGGEGRVVTDEVEVGAAEERWVGGRSARRRRRARARRVRQRGRRWGRRDGQVSRQV
jgi:hypothetical protein